MVGSGRTSDMNCPSPQESKWISRSLRHDTKFPVNSLTKYLSTEALGEDAFVGGLYEMIGAAMSMGTRLSRMADVECEDEADR